jgi:uncharacterized iron-regulated membrane protein
MSKTKINALANILSFVDFILVLVSSIALSILPQGFQGGKNPNYLTAEFLGGGRHFWEDLHAWSGWIMLGLIALHLILHLNWVKCLPEIFSKKEEIEK